MNKPKLQSKLFDVADFKSYEENGRVVISGYANTKNVADRYGDVPTVFTPLRTFVYDVADFRKNPVMLIDHTNAIDHVAGSFVELTEDDRGLFVKAVFSNSDFPLVKHARTVYLEGHAKAFSIAGYWYFEDKENPTHLTLAEICEISVVGVGADANALGQAALEKALAAEQERTAAEHEKAIAEEAAKKEKADLLSQSIKTAQDILGSIPK